MILSMNLYAQETEVGASVKTVGGSYYDVKSDHELDKYGPERIAPTGVAFVGTLDSDKYGDAFIRYMKVARSEDKKSLGSQVFFTYESPKVKIKEGKDWNMFLRGDFVHYSQKDHFIYLQVDKNLNSTIEKELELPDARVNQSQTYIYPEAGFCFGKEMEAGEVALEGFVEATLAPVAFLNHKTEAKEGALKEELAHLNKAGNVLASGGSLSFAGMAKFKDHYYLKIKVSQDFKTGISGNKVSMNNRMISGEVGYTLKNNLSVNANFGNNELVLKDKERRSIEVYNTLGVGLSYKIPSRKKN